MEYNEEKKITDFNLPGFCTDVDAYRLHVPMMSISSIMTKCEKAGQNVWK